MLLKFAQCSFQLKVKKIPKGISYISDGNDCLASVGSKIPIGLFSLLIFLKFIAEGTLIFLIYISIKIFTAPIAIAVSLVFPKYAYKQDAICAVYLYNTWES